MFDFGGFFGGLRPGQEIDVRDLQQLNQALRDNSLGVAKGGVGYPLQGVGYDSTTLSGGELAPLVPQSIQTTLDSATFTLDDVVFWKLLGQVEATSPLHEYNILKSHGSHALDPFFAEGAVGGVSEANYERKTVRMKYLMEYIQVTDIAAMTGLGGVNKNVLAQRTVDGTLSLMQKLEAQLFWADSANSPLAFDGLYSSMKNDAPNNYTAFNGASASPQDLNSILGTLVSPPYYARPTAILCDLRHFQSLVNQATVYGRHDLMAPQNGVKGLFFAQDKLFVGSARGAVPIFPVPFISHRDRCIESAQGDGSPTVIVPAVALAAGPITGSEWAAADLGYDYYYKFEMVGDMGTTPTAIIGPFTPAAAADAATITFADAAVATSGSGSIRYYRAFRAKVATGAAAPTANADFHWCGNFARNTAGGGGSSSFRDLREFLPNSAPMFIIQNTPDVMRWTRFLDFMRRPITVSRTTTQQFALMLFGAFTLGIATKNWVCRNVGF